MSRFTGRDPRRRLPAALEEAFRVAYRQGLPHRLLAALFGLGMATVSREARRLRLPRRGQGRRVPVGM